jgi:4-aminobutyrate aminotransferase-like enzyme/Ser/Thr protein kinase RdoA (MazF antagonist)
MSDVRLKPTFSVADVEAIVYKNYGLSGAVRELPGERDQNFQISTKNSLEYVLKIANPAEDGEVLVFQNQVLDRLAEREPSLAIPRLVTSGLRDPIIRVADKAGDHYYARLLTYLPGFPLADVTTERGQLHENLGRFLGRLDRALTGYWHPAANRPLQWSVNRATKVIGQRIDHIRDVENRAIVEYFLADFESRVVPLLPSLRSGVIHNDGNDYNVLVTLDEDGHQEISGVIDFGDLIYGPYVYEPAVAAAYAILDEDDILTTAVRVIKGYHEEFPLLADEVELLFTLICIRLCTSVTLASVQKELVPDNEYLTISEQAAWNTLSQLVGLDPQIAANRFLKACQLTSGRESLGANQIQNLREHHLSPSFSVSYKNPLKIVRGFRQYLYDERGKAYLDAVNNVPHVGHCHPRVVRAGQRQMAVLNTNTRYLHENLVRYAAALCDTLPESLSVCFFVCTGSEANELALRLAQTHTGERDIIVVDGAYHGNTGSLVDISPYKFDGPGGRGVPNHVHKVLMPDPYRGPYKSDDPEAGAKYATHAREVADDVSKNGRGIAAFICESLLGCGGQIPLPEDYLSYVYYYMRSAGAVCIADEVQVGFGRVGTHFWGFETQNVVPDIVTMGKPMGNGHPLAAVVTTREIASSFDNGMEYFNTYGGNPVSCAIGLAVLDVIVEEGLQQNALEVGAKLKAGLKRLQQEHALIGDVRGLGLFLGVELVRDRVTLAPAAEEAAAVVESMKENGILISTDGPLHNVLKIKPPLVFSEANANHFVKTLDRVLSLVE